MTKDETKKPAKFDLEDRTGSFGEHVIAFAKRIPLNPITTPLIGQLVRAAASVGANYCEANDADSKKDFRFKIGLCRARPRRLSTGCGWWSLPNPTFAKRPEPSGRRRRN